jgi:hypothetical protein
LQIVRQRPAGADDPAQRAGQLLDQGKVVPALEASPDRHDNVRLVDADPAAVAVPRADAAQTRRWSLDP